MILQDFSVSVNHETAPKVCGLCKITGEKFLKSNISKEPTTLSVTL